MTAPAKGFRSLKEMGVRPDRPVGVNPLEERVSLAQKAADLRDTLTRVQVDAAARRQGLVSEDPTPGGDSMAEEFLGVANPFGSSTRAFEPNTVLFDQYQGAYGDMAASKAKEAQAAAAAAEKAATAAPAGSAGTPLVNASGKAKAFIDAALTAVGKMYVWGGTSLKTGVDCSGLIYAAMNAAGIKWNRLRAVDYRNVGQQVSADQARPGDVVWIDNPNSDTDHVGIYIGDGQMIESPTSGQRTKISAVGNRATQYRRIFEDDQVAPTLQMGGSVGWSYGGEPWRVDAAAAFREMNERSILDRRRF